MGNISPTTALCDNGVAFAEIMAFIFSDLVVLPVLRIQARYYGWPVALYVLVVFLVILVASALSCTRPSLSSIYCPWKPPGRG